MSGMSYSDNKAEAFQAIVFGVDGDGTNKGLSHSCAFTNSASDSLDLEPETSMIELFADNDCWVLLKESASAAAAAIPSDRVKTKAKFVASDVTFFMGIPKVDGVVYKLSIIRNSADGTIKITEGA